MKRLEAVLATLSADGTAPGVVARLPGECLREEASLARSERGRLRCLACGRRCLLAEGEAGACGVRGNRGGRLQVPWGHVATLRIGPVELFPFHHLRPGGTLLAFGMLGCDQRCPFCLEWRTSQFPRDPEAVAPVHPVATSDLATLALASSARVVAAAHNEPLVSAEWTAAVLRSAHQAGLDGAMETDGNLTPEALDLLAPALTACHIDLKGLDAARYRAGGGNLSRVLAAIHQVHARGIWLEVSTPVVPGWNDRPEELRAVARFLAGVDPGIPWHLRPFEPAYRMGTTPRPTPGALQHAAELGAAEGLRFVYTPTPPGHGLPWEHTWCPGCRSLLIERHGGQVLNYRLTRDGRCPRCATVIPGVWDEEGPDAGLRDLAL